MLGRGVEALVSWTAGKAAALERHVAGHRVPWVLFDQAVAGAPALAASSGRRSGAALACRYLLSLGHRRFGLLAAAGADMAEEVLGVLATTVATTLDAHPVASGADLDGAQTAVGELLDQGKATAIICASDLLALAALRECARRGVSVPAAISVVGFGDSPLARFGSPPVTSIRVSPEEIAARTVEALLLALAGGTPAAIETLPKLVIRESTGQATP
jgi:DNA-binding LacI/PurR family transcriptional regulator